jgi:predicted permease
MWRDLSFAVRTLRRSPLFAGMAVLSLALGIGATTAIFSLVDQVLLRMLPVRDPGRLVLLHRQYNPQGNSTSDNFESVFSYPMYRELRDRDPAYSGVIARAFARVAVAYRGETKAASAEVVSGNFFQVLGAGPAIGRTFTAEDDITPGGHPVVMLSHNYWSTRFGNDPAILNQPIAINGQPMVVIGVSGAGFYGLQRGSTPDLFVPITMQKTVRPTWNVLDDRQFRWLNIFARLKPEFDLNQAQAATSVLYRSILESELAQNPKMIGKNEREKFLNHRVEVRLAAEGINGLRRKWEKPLSAVMAMIGLVLLITCANIAGLMLARAAGRQREMAIRLALGASRWTLVKQLLLEALLLSVAAGLLGLVGALWSSEALIRVLPSDLSGTWLKASLDLRLLGFTTVLSGVCCVLFGLIPALQASRPDVATTLKDQVTQMSPTGGATRLRQLMVTAQVAFSLVLLVGAGMFAESLFRLMNADLGFHTEQLLTISVDATPSRPELSSAVAFYTELQDRLGAIGGVVSAGASTSGPFSGNSASGNITVDGYRAAPDEATGAEFSAIGPNFFQALRIPLRAGREFGERDNASAPKAVVVNEAFVKRYFGTENPIGRRLMFGGSNRPVFDREIVGVVTNSQTDVRTPAKETIYYPYAQWVKPERLVYYIRTAGAEAPVAPQVRSLIRSIDPGVVVGDPQPMTVLVRNSMYTDRLLAILSTAFGVLATLLAAVGLYGVVGYAVARRTAEIGVRMALGALPGDVMRMVLWEAARMVAGGVLVGLAGAIALERLLRSQLFGVQRADAGLLIGAAALLALITVAAAFLPAWRASRIDPMVALKYE